MLMKAYPLTSALFAATSLSASAFSVDFNDLVGQTIQNPAAAGELNRFEILVPGYGSVTILANSGKTLALGQSFSNDTTTINSLEFDDEDSVTVRFNGPTAINIDFDYVGFSFGDDFDVIAVANPSMDTDYIIQFETTLQDGSAALREISFDAVPEPSTALLCGLSLLGLLRRRR